MALPDSNGIFDQANSKIIASSSLTWDQLGAADSAGATVYSTWDDWNSWVGTPTTPLTWLTDVVDLQETGSFNLTWEIECSGTPTFTIYTSNTGSFSGEETTTTINVGDTNIAAFTGRYCAIFISVAEEAASGIPEITTFEFEASGNRFDIQQFDINSVNLTGSASARQINMPRDVSKVLAMNITAQASNYMDADYVADNYIEDSPVTLPVIISKTRSAPEISFSNLSGTRTDAIFDIRLTCLPEQFMDGNNMAVR